MVALHESAETSRCEVSRDGAGDRGRASGVQDRAKTRRNRWVYLIDCSARLLSVDPCEKQVFLVRKALHWNRP